MGQQHVLLIGIDAYDGGGSLTGCVNDIDEVQHVLTEHVGIGGDRITRLASPVRKPGDSLPTLEAIRRELVRLADVDPGDRVLIYYSGHGTQCILAGRDGKRFSREALLPKDKVHGPKRRYLFDWQLNQLIGRIAERTPRVTVILDCCSSAGVTRDVSGETANTADRFFPSNDVYQLGVDDDWTDSLVRGITPSLGVAPGIQLIAACRDDERAREIRPDNRPAYGLLTRALVTAIKQVPGDDLAKLRWGRIWRAIERNVRADNPRQNPYISGAFGRHVFGFCADEDADCGYAVVAVSGGYELDVGRLHGVTPGAEIAVYPEQPLRFPRYGSVDDRPVGRLRVKEPVRASTAFAEAIAPFILPASARGRLVKAGSDARLRVRLVPHDPGMAAQIAGSDLIEVVTDRGDVDVELVQRQGAWVITDDVHGYGENAIASELVAIAPSRLMLVRAALEHYHAYSAPIRLARACRDLPNLLHITALDCTNRTVDEKEAQDPRLPLVEGGQRASYEVSPGTQVCFVVQNASDVALWVTLIDCATSGRVQILGEQLIGAHARRAFWADDHLGAPWVISLPDERPSGVDRFIAIGTTNRTSSLQHLRRSMSFEEVLNPRRTVRAGAELRVPLPAEQWTSAMTTLRITAPAGRQQSDLWIYLSGTPDDFTSSTVPLAGSPITLLHRLPMSSTELQVSMTSMSGGEDSRKLASDMGDLSRTVGAQLFETLFGVELREVLRQHRRSSQFVRLRLQLESPQLNALPWEFLYDTTRKDYMGLSSEFAVVRSFEPQSSQWLPYTPFEPPIRVLFVAESDHTHHPRLDEYRTEVAERVRLDELKDVLTKRGADIIQLDAHGTLDGRLRLGGTVVDAEALTQLFASANPRPRLLLLLASNSDAVAFTIGRHGIAEAVIGVRGNVSDAAVQLFTDRFYVALARGASVIHSVTEARRAVDLGMPGQDDWGLFTLYHRAGDLAFEPRPQNQTGTAVTVSDPAHPAPVAPEIEMLRRNLREIDERLSRNDPRGKLLERQRQHIIAELERLRS
jgi:hypothetical protein